MDTLNIILNIVLIICSGVLVLSVLLQSTKSAGLGGPLAEIRSHLQRVAGRQARR